MEIKDVVMPKWFLDTKRGVGMLLVGLSTFAPMVAMYFGVTLDPAAIGTLANAVVDWVGTGMQIAGYALWLYGSFRPTAPLAVLKP